jgi:hypothetical protein
MNDIWDKNFKRRACLHTALESLEKKLSFQLPKSYKNLMLVQNGGYIKKDEFAYENGYLHQKRNGIIGIFFSIGNNSDETLERYLSDPPEFFPKGLIPFCGDSSLICFDYRDGFEKEPNIVIWCPGDPENKDVHFVANSFEEFINMLHEPLDNESVS